MLKHLPRHIKNSVEDLKPFANIRLVVADLDGTLLSPEESHMWEEILTFKNRINHYKTKLTIATGRTLSGVKSIIEFLEIQRGIPIVLYNGSLVVINGTFQTIVKKTIPLETLEQILKVTEGKSVQILAYFYEGDSLRELTLSSMDFEYVLGWSEIERPEHEFNKMPVKWLNWDDPPTRPSSLLAWLEWENSPTPSSLLAILIDTTRDVADRNLIENVINKIPGITVTRSGTRFLEIRPEGSDKGQAIKESSSLLGYSREEILAIGDNDNDAELLAWAGIGVAVKSSSKKALESSHYICEYDSTGGAIEVLRLVRDARRYYEKDREIKLTL